MKYKLVKLLLEETSPIDLMMYIHQVLMETGKKDKGILFKSKLEKAYPTTKLPWKV